MPWMKTFGLGGKIISQREFTLIDVITVKVPRIEFRLNLAGRAPCDLEKTNEFGLVSRVKSFGNIVHDEPAAS